AVTATTTTTTTILTTIPLPPQTQQVSSDSILLNHLGELKQHIADLVDANQALEERLDKHGSRLYKLENQDIPNSKVVDEIVMDVVDWAMHAPLRERFRDLPEVNMKEILHNRMWESKSYQTHEDHMTLYEALEKSMARDNREQLLSDLAEARKKKKKRQGSPKTPSGSPLHPPPPAGPSGTSRASGASGSSQSPPPPPSPSNTQGGHSTGTDAPSSSKTAASAEYTAWTMTDTTIKPSISLIPEELHMGDDSTADEQAYSLSGEDIGRDHIPMVNLRQSWWKPITEDRPATLEPAWSIPSSDLTVPMNNWASALKSTYTPPPENSLLAQIGDMATFMDCASQVPNGRIHKPSHRSSDDQILRYNDSKPLPMGGDLVKSQYNWISSSTKTWNIIWYSRKIGDGTLTQIDEALDYRVKEFRVNRRNPCLDTRLWTNKDVDRKQGVSVAYKTT
ncbi:hypothetical protein Tco_1436620, partial [Tanacetum coccineum]